jgi:hypothetical protein
MAQTSLSAPVVVFALHAAGGCPLLALRYLKGELKGIQGRRGGGVLKILETDLSELWDPLEDTPVQSFSVGGGVLKLDDA